MITNGVFNTTLNPNELNMRSFAAHMLRLFPNGSTPLFGITALTGKARAKAATHGYFSKTMTFVTATLGAGNLAADTTIVVPSTTGMGEFQTYHNVRTKENIRIVTVVDATSIIIQRSFGRIAAADMNVADVLIHTGTAFPEGSNRPTARRLSTVHIPNFTQIFRDAWALTDTARASMSENGYDNVQEDRTDAALFHSLAIETAIIWGQANMDTSGPQPSHSTQGILDAIRQYAPSHSNVAGATTTYPQLVSLIEPAFEFSADIGNPTERLGFGDAQAIRVLHDIGRLYGSIEITQDETSFGMQFTSFKTYKGTIHLREHPVMNGLNQAGSLMIIDPKALQLAYLDGRDTKAEEYGMDGKLLENGVDGVGGSLTTEAAVELINPYACAIIDGLTAAA